MVKKYIQPEPKFEKINDYTIRMIVENATDIPLKDLLLRQEELLKQQIQVNNQKQTIDKLLTDIDNILANADKLGIKPEEIQKDTPKKE